MKSAAWLALFALGCAAGKSPRPSETAPSALEADPPALEIDPAVLRAIARLEDARTIGPNAELLAALADKDPAVRARAATAVGRLRFPDGGEAATAGLRELLRDSKHSVRATAAFALGMREDPSAYEDLIALGVGAKKDESALVRARALEAASRLDRLELCESFLGGLEDPAAEVRLEAAAGTARWKADAPRASDVNARLAAFVAAESDSRARIHGLFALERRKAKQGREVFLKSARAQDVDERLFAVRGLAALAGDAEIDAALSQASRDGDWRVAVEALRGLGKSGSRVSLEALTAATKSENHHVRSTAVESATAQFDAIAASDLFGQAEGVGVFSLGLSDPSIAAQCAMVPNLVRLGAEIGLQRSNSSHVRSAIVRQYGRPTPSGSMAPFMSHKERNAEKSLLVLGTYVEKLGELKEPEASERLRAYVHDSDNGLSLAAVTALLAQEQPRVDVAELASRYELSTGEIASELRFNILRLAAKLGGDGARKLLERGLDDPDAFVRRTAHVELERITGAKLPWTDRALPEVELGFAGEGPLANVRPRVVIATSRGEMEFVLFADEAPQHVLNFLKHVDFYKGTTFHRVVSDFVVQGGDARGDGNGGSSWRGDSLRQEFTPRKYVRGSLGMPRNEDPDSGGSQIFVTHRSTPHLDGRYTIFGELSKGFDVLDAIDLGDRILEVRVLP